jgi:Calx-beta domain/Bacterial pre-peptidase C-terminal domain
MQGVPAAVGLSNRRTGAFRALSLLFLAVAVTVVHSQSATPELEPNNSPATATPLDVSSGVAVASGAIGIAGDHDFFSFTAPAGAKLWLLVDTGGSQLPGATSRDSLVTLYAGNGTTFIEEDDNDGSGNGADFTEETGLASAITGRTLVSGGTYYAKISEAANTGIINPYKLYVMVSFATASPESEGNDSPGIANPILQLGLPVGVRSGAISSPTDVDVYSVTVAAGNTLVIGLDANPGRTGAATDLLVELVSTDQVNILYTANSSGDESGASESFAFAVPAPGTYFARVRHASGGTGSYQLAVGTIGSGALHFGAPSYSVLENVGNATVTVFRSGGSTGLVSVQFSTLNGTATAPADYTGNSTLLTFAQGVNTQTVMVPIANDSSVEPNETIHLILSAPTGGAVLGGRSNSVLVILDNDEIPDSATGSARSLNLNSGLTIVSSLASGVPPMISPGGDEDLYSFTGASGSRLWALVDTGGDPGPGSTSGDSVLTLLAANGASVVEEDNDDGSGNGGDSTLDFDGDLASAIAGRTLPGTGVYYLRIKADSTDAILDPYKLFAVLTQSSSPELEPNSSPATATSIVTSNGPVGSRDGQIGLAGDVDFYSVSASSNAVILVSADCDPQRDGNSTDLLVSLIDSDGATILFTADSSSDEPEAAESFSFRIPHDGVFHVMVRHFSPTGTGAYSLMVARAAADPSIAEIKRINADTRLTFMTTAGKYYRVERAPALGSTNSWTVLPGTIEGTGSAVQFLDAGGATQAQRFYRIRELP